MPSIEESKRQVKAGLETRPDLDHDAILASLQDEIDLHNEKSEPPTGSKGGHDLSQDDEANRSSMKFRFKASTVDPRKRKHRSKDHRRHHDDHGGGHRKQRKKDAEVGPEAAHPFPREPMHSEQSGQLDPNAAFRESLFDALADDEGAAYWEGVYNQPIHIYPRPSVEAKPGEMDRMNDEDYAAYVQTKMWEKKNPHIVLERQRQEKQRKEEEDERTRRREEYIKRKEQAAWERAEKAGAKRFAGMDAQRDENSYEYVFDHECKIYGPSMKSTDRESYSEFSDAWAKYSAAWDGLKIDLLNARDNGSFDSFASSKPSGRIPWPVLASKPVTKPNIEEFLRHMPPETGLSKLQQLKAERVKWHPDKVQQRFGGHVDEGTMKVVTGIFQVIDTLVESERKLS